MPARPKSGLEQSLGPGARDGLSGCRDTSRPQPPAGRLTATSRDFLQGEKIQPRAWMGRARSGSVTAFLFHTWDEQVLVAVRVRGSEHQASLSLAHIPNSLNLIPVENVRKLA
jgi:hypothetical protein